MFKNKKLVLKGLAVAAAMLGLAKVIAAIAFVPDAQPVGYVGQPVASSANVSSGTAKIYSIDYDSGNWSGNLHAFSLSSAGVVGATDNWSGGAAAQLDAQATRYIATMKDNGSKIPFAWADLSTAQQTALGTSAILDYLRGSRTGEGTTYRTRGSRLGDIIHSTPVYLDDGTNKTVFVGANDGMMHAINAATGAERFAYVPSMLIPKLGALSTPGYTHQYYVDGRLSVQKFAAPTSKTILVGALGAGGRGLFALDVSNANATSDTDAANKVLWEITNTSLNNSASTVYADLGYTYSAPILFTMPNGTPALVVGNGYNNIGNGHAILYLINATDGSLIRKFDTGSGTSGSPNGLSSPALWDTDGDGKLDVAYAGDIDGHLWKFDLVAGTVTSLYTNSAGASQAITMAPALKKFADAADPTLTGVMVSFVTGRMLNSDDVTNTAYHYAYGIWDGAPTANNALLTQDLTETNFTGVTPSIRVRTSTANTPNWTSGTGHHKGWKTKLPIGGERVVGDGAFVTGNVFQFFSTNPTISPKAVPPGENWWMQLNAMTGGEAGMTLFDLDGDGAFTSDDGVNGKDPVGRDMGGGVRSQLIGLSANGVDIYQSNYDKNSAPPPVVVVPPTVTTTVVTSGDRGISDGHFDFDVFCYTNCRDKVNATPGSTNTGTNSSTNTLNLKWTHMHEYDDIYDKTGVNLLAPSQDLHRLSRVKYGSTAPTYSTSLTPDTPALKAAQTYPTTGVTLVSTTNGTNKTATALPVSTFSYVNGVTKDVTTFPNTVVSGTNAVTTVNTKYTTTLTKVEAIPTGPKNASGKYPYYLQTTVRTWDTITTYVTTAPNFKFKVLLSNQAYSPAVHLSLDGASTKAYEHQAVAGLTMASLPTYQLGTIKSLALEMPLDAFLSKNWGTGQTRAGLHPTTYNCAVANPRDGTLGERRDGAITVQIVDASVSDSDVQQAVTAKPGLGYRLKDGSMASKLIAEYIIFWHHPSELCMASSGYTITPSQDSASSSSGNPPALGSNDPFAGNFGIGDPTPLPTAGTTTTTVVNPDGSTTTTVVVTTVTAGGGSTVTTTVTLTPKPAVSGSGTASGSGIVTGGAVCAGISCIDSAGVSTISAIVGRITWRELQK
jgi:type IV pilus assembly protein PilY1